MINATYGLIQEGNYLTLRRIYLDGAEVIEVDSEPVTIEGQSVRGILEMLKTIIKEIEFAPVVSDDHMLIDPDFDDMDDMQLSVYEEDEDEEEEILDCVDMFKKGF